MKIWSKVSIVGVSFLSWAAWTACNSSSSDFAVAQQLATETQAATANEGAQSASEPAKDAQASEATTEQPTQKPTPDQLGLTTEKPTKKPFVELPDGRFMVPYTTTIPGTDVEFTMTPIAGGKFKMGSPESEEGREEDEGPQFNVNVEPFWMGQHEVTWAEYKKYMLLDNVFKTLQDQGKRNVTAENEIDGVTAPSELYDPSFTFELGSEPEQAAASMTQFAAKQYTKWLSLMANTFYRLPTEAEWEYACRAGTDTAYFFGDDADDLEEYGWYSSNSNEERHAVGELKPNPWGLYDMYGNVAEWVLDQYSEEGYTHIEAGASVSTEKAFSKPTELFPRVVRGGSFELDEEQCRSASRLASHDEDWRYEDPNIPKSPWWFTDSPALGVGFRLLRPLQEPATRDAKEAVWSADLEDINEDAQNRIEQNGRGSWGTVDPDLAEQIRELE